MNNPIYNLFERFRLFFGKDISDWREILERMIEFEVVKDDNVIDLISVNSLFDFYNIKFNEKDFINFIKIGGVSKLPLTGYKITDWMDKYPLTEYRII